MKSFPTAMPVTFPKSEYRNAVLKDMDDSERVPFESWFDNSYSCYMYELNLDELLVEWQEYK